MADSNHSAPDFAVYTVKDRKHGQDPFWLRIGAAWINKDEHGYNVQQGNRMNDFTLPR